MAITLFNPSTGCGDVLTKPKLDKHRTVCHSSFDCIDCSKRFESPADYKGHTSCISEAEKYQKTLYNGGVSEHAAGCVTSDSTGSRKQSGPGRDNKNQRSWQQGGGSQRGNHRPQWQRRDANRATGANDTPLGTPIRMSPVNDAPVVKEDVQKGQPAVGTSKKRKAESKITESKVRFYQLSNLHVFIANRILPNQRRRKRSRKPRGVGRRRSRSTSQRYGVPAFFATFLKPDRLLG